MELNALRTWAEGKNGYLAHYAQWAAVTAVGCFELCRLAQTERLYSLVQERVSPQVWLGFYRGRLNASKKGWKAYLRAQRFPRGLSQAHEAAFKAWTAKKGSFIVGAKKNREIERRYWLALEDWHYQSLAEPDDGEDFGRLMQSNPAVAFTFRVDIPHQLIWGGSVTALYRKARLGDPASIGRLLRLDPTTIEDNRIRAQKLKVLKMGGRTAKSLQHELTQDASRLITLGNMKVLLAAEVVKLSKAVERELKAIAKRTRGMKVGRIRFEELEMRELFDAVAQDFRGEEIDTDIPDSKEAFSKALQRAQRFWPKY